MAPCSTVKLLSGQPGHHCLGKWLSVVALVFVVHAAVFLMYSTEALLARRRPFRRAERPRYSVTGPGGEAISLKGGLLKPKLDKDCSDGSCRQFTLLWEPFGRSWELKVIESGEGEKMYFLGCEGQRDRAQVTEPCLKVVSEALEKENILKLVVQFPWDGLPAIARLNENSLKQLSIGVEFFEKCTKPSFINTGYDFSNDYTQALQLEESTCAGGTSYMFNPSAVNLYPREKRYGIQLEKEGTELVRCHWPVRIALPKDTEIRDESSERIEAPFQRSALWSGQTGRWLIPGFLTEEALKNNEAKALSDSSRHLAQDKLTLQSSEKAKLLKLGIKCGSSDLVRIEARQFVLSAADMEVMVPSRSFPLAEMKDHVYVIYLKSFHPLLESRNPGGFSRPGTEVHRRLCNAQSPWTVRDCIHTLNFGFPGDKAVRLISEDTVELQEATSLLKATTTASITFLVRLDKEDKLGSEFRNDENKSFNLQRFLGYNLSTGNGIGSIPNAGFYTVGDKTCYRELIIKFNAEHFNLQEEGTAERWLPITRGKVRVQMFLAKAVVRVGRKSGEILQPAQDTLVLQRIGGSSRDRGVVKCRTPLMDIRVNQEPLIIKRERMDVSVTHSSLLNLPPAHPRR